MYNPDLDHLRLPTVKLATLALSLAAPVANATDIEPRTYANISVGMIFFIAAYGYTTGSVSFAPSVQIKNGELTIHSALLAFLNSLDIWGHSGNDSEIRSFGTSRA